MPSFVRFGSLVGASLLHLGCSASPDASTSRDAGTDVAPLPRMAGSHHDAGAARDAGDDAVGAPSTTYPAPHPPLPQLMNAAGGPILTSPRVYLLVYPGYPYTADLQTFATRLTTAAYWGSATAQYGVGPLAYGGTVTLTGQTPPTTITSAEIEAWMASSLASGAFGTPDPQGIYTIFYPSGTTVTQPNPVLPSLAPLASCVAFGGYHDDVAVTLADGGAPTMLADSGASGARADGGATTTFSYAVIPTCDSSVQDLTAVVSHEWVESSTDPFVTSATTGAFSLMGGADSAFFTVDAAHAVWALLGGGEAGDLCEPEGNSVYVTPPDVGYLVQRTWSNELAKQSHDPCAPDPTGVAYFNSAPVLPEAVTVTSSLTGTVVTQGITIPVGESRTIEVDLFSDGDTGGPWTVSAADVLYALYGSYGLANTLGFAWDRTEGENGQKLHLTITVLRASLIAGAHAFMITSTKGARQSVWAGLIVE